MEENQAQRTIASMRKERRMKAKEQKVLKKLDIPDFQHMTQNKLMSFVSMLDKMDPEVAKAALEQFPEFAQSATTIMNYVRETIQNTLDSDDVVTQQIMTTCQNIIVTLEEQLKRDDISSEERIALSNQIGDILKMMQSTQARSQNWKLTVLGLLGGISVVITAILSSNLGSGTEIHTQNKND